MSLEVKGIVAGYGEADILHEVSLHAEPQKMTCLIGPNGAGKSTLLRVIFGMLKPKQGKITLDRQDITGQKPHSLLRRGICYVLQGRSVFPYMSVWENLEMGVYIRKDYKQIEKDIDEVLELFPRLRERKNQMAGTMSGGEQRMLELARVMLLKPRVLLLDEPSAGLAPKFFDIVFRQVELMKERKMTVLVVEQQIQKILSISDYGYVLDLGKVVLQGCCNELLNNDELIRLYLGE